MLSSFNTPDTSAKNKTANGRVKVDPTCKITRKLGKFHLCLEETLHYRDES